jgi:hypothetical protein
MDLYCDNENAHEYESGVLVMPSYQGEYTGNSRAECIRNARKDGWTINLKTWKCYCPKCKRKREIK